MKTTGYEWKKFYSDPDIWENETWHDDELILVNGKNVSDDAGFDYSAVSDTDIIDIKSGVIYIGPYDDEVYPLVSVFRKWKKKQDRETVVISYKKADRGRVMEMIAIAGAKVEA